MKQFNIKNLQKMIDEKYVSVQKHPSQDLWIYNYTQKCQFDRMWNYETMNCRGLILDGDGNIAARPFPKFFNLDEAIAMGEQLPLEDFEVFEKYDGSLGILYFISDGTSHLATRGSFTSDQAMIGTRILKDKYSHVHFNPNWTYLFEIIYKQNRIVVDYGDMEDLVLLAMVHNETGKEGSVDDYADILTVRKRYDGIEDYTKLKEMAEENKEGFVIRFKSGKRYKVKFDEYVRLHRIVTGINARRIWDILRNNESMTEILDRVPDEFFKWVRTTTDDLLEKYEAIKKESIETCEVAQDFYTRKESAEYILKTSKTPGVAFAMLDGKDYKPMIWDLLKPKHEVPFKTEI